MIELGALLGAMVFTLAALISLGETRDARTELAWTFLGAPSSGAIWGALVAGLIHVIANGSLLGAVLGIIHHR